MKVSLPDSWTKSDVKGFLRYLKPDPEDREVRDSLIAEDPKHHCWRGGLCMFWRQDDEEEYQGHCALGSCACSTAIFNRQNPTRWLPK